MDVLLSRVTQQAMQYAIRSGISITTGYAIKQGVRLLQEAPRGREREELRDLQIRLESKIRIISPSIDMIELISARGNTSLDSAVSLTKDIRYDIQKLGTRLANAANQEELSRRKSSRARPREQADVELKAIASQMRLLLARIEDAVPLINLAITTSGVNLSTSLSGSISPSRLLQASTFLTAADSSFMSDPTGRQQVGPTYVLSMYMLFAGHAARPIEEGARETTWKEVLHKAHFKLWRIPLDQLYSRPGEAPTASPGNIMPAETKVAEFAYQLVLVEDLDDDRVHTFEHDDENQPGPFDDVQNAGIRDVIPIHEVSKVFYADTGKILNIGGDGEANNPVLLLKRDVHAEPPRRMMQRSQSRQSFDDEAPANHTSDRDVRAEIEAQFEQESTPNTPRKTDSNPRDDWRLPVDLDPEWIALEVFTEEPDSESDSETGTELERPSTSKSDSTEPGIPSAFRQLSLRPPATRSDSASSIKQTVPNIQHTSLQTSPNKRFGPPVKTSLSLLEMLMKLAALQQFRQESHLAIEDELLNFFLEDSATAGAGSDKENRQRVRRDAQRRVGFDPYDESPVKRRSEDYIQHANYNASPRSNAESGFYGHDGDQDEYPFSHGEPLPRLDFRRGSAGSNWENQRTPGSSPLGGVPLHRQASHSSTSDAFRGQSNSRTHKSRPNRLSSSPSPSLTPAQDFARNQADSKARSPLVREVTRD